MLGSKEMSKKTKESKVEPTPNSSICFRHFSEHNYICCFNFVDEVTNEPIMPRLKRDEFSTTAVPSSPCRSSPPVTTLTEV